MKVIICVIFAFGFVQCAVDWDEIRDRKIYTYLRVETKSDFPQNDARVVGGLEAEPHQFPYQIGLVMNFSNGDQAFCGGSLISPNYILTAAHCVDGVENVEAIFGAHRIREKEVTQIRVVSDKFIIHEEWNPNLLRNDIALVKLPAPVSLNKYIQEITLPPRSNRKKYTEDTATISGWGKDFDVSNQISPVLRYVEVDIENNFRCGLSYPFFIQSSHICTSGRDGKSSCNGDSGGPLTVQENGSTIQIGLVSFGRAAGCEKGHPAVFTRITSFLEWIEKNSDAEIAL